MGKLSLVIKQLYYCRKVFCATLFCKVENRFLNVVLRFLLYWHIHKIKFYFIKGFCKKIYNLNMIYKHFTEKKFTENLSDKNEPLE